MNCTYALGSVQDTKFYQQPVSTHPDNNNNNNNNNNDSKNNNDNNNNNNNNNTLNLNTYYLDSDYSTQQIHKCIIIIFS